MLIEVGRRVVLKVKFSMIQAVDKTLEESHHRAWIVEIPAVAAVSIGWPVGRLSILNHIDAAIIQQRKQKPECLNDMTVNVAAVVNHNVE